MLKHPVSDSGVRKDIFFPAITNDLNSHLCFWKFSRAVLIADVSLFAFTLCCDAFQVLLAVQNRF